MKEPKQTDFRFGQKVHHISMIGKKDLQNGIVKSKSFDDTGIFVVFKCNNDWDNYMNYTGVYCSPDMLIDGWQKTKSKIDLSVGEYMTALEGNPSAMIKWNRCIDIMAEYNQYKTIKIIEDLWWFGLDEAAERVFKEYGHFNYWNTIKELGNFPADFLNYLDDLFIGKVQE